MNEAKIELVSSLQPSLSFGAQGKDLSDLCNNLFYSSMVGNIFQGKTYKNIIDTPEKKRSVIHTPLTKINLYFSLYLAEKTTQKGGKFLHIF